VKALQRSRAFFALTLVVGAVFAYLALRNVKFAETWDALKQSNYWWLIPSLALLTASTFLRALRWQLLFSQRRRPPLRAAWDANLVGLFFNSVLPARAGDAARVAALKKYAGTPMAESAATVAVERVFDVLSLLALLFISAPFLPHVSWLRAAALLALVLAVGLAGVICSIALFGDRPLRFVLGPLKRFPRVSEEHVEREVENLAHGLAALRNARLGVGNFLLTTLSWLVLGVGFWLLMLGFDLDVSPLAGVLAVVAVGLALIVPSPPAAVGVFEAAGLAALNPYGISGSRALAYVAVLHALNIIPFTIAGLVVLAGPRRRVAPDTLPALRPDNWDNHWQNYGEAAEQNPAQEFRRRLVLDQLEADEGARILDIGSGTGDLAADLLQALPGTKVVGLELSSSGLEIARKKAPRATFVQRDLLVDGDPAPYRAWATHAVCSEVLEHVDRPERLLANAVAYLAPGCRLVVTVPGGPVSKFDRHIGHRRHFTPGDVEGLLEQSGFQVERVSGAGFPFFNLYRLLIVLRGRRLVDDVRQRDTPSFAARAAGQIFRFLFHLSWQRSRAGWQIVASARLPGKAS
jgi:uncharacterized protein (TIRG00374 family)